MISVPIKPEITKKIIDNDGRLYLVGGAVRDYLLDRKIHDYDFCVTGLTKENFEELFPDAKLIGKNFPVYLLNGYEFAFARKEIKVSNGYKGFEVDFNPNITIKEDLKRRDLTINSMAVDLWSGETIDPFGGEKDLNYELLYPTSEAFKEDPLRVYRVARFGAELEFKPHMSLIEYMNSLSGELNSLSTERVFEELKKALNGKEPHLFFKYLRKADVLHVHFREIFYLINTPQVEEYHPEGSAFKHTMQTLKIITSLTDKEHVIFAILIHDIGKGLTPLRQLPHHYEHCKLGLDALDNSANRIPLPKKWYRSAKIVIKEHMRITNWKVMSPGKVVRLFKRIKKSPLTIEDMVNVVKADKLGRDNPDDIVTCINGIKELYYKMFEETGGENVNSKRYSGKEFGEQLFQYRCHWLKKERNKILNRS